MRRRRTSIVWATSAAVVAILLVASCSNPTAPVSAPSSPASDVRVLDDCPELPCEGSLEPGKYRWAFHEPTLDFEISSPGWIWHFGGGGNLRFYADETPVGEGLYGSDGIYFLADPTIASRNCEDSSMPGVGHSMGDIVGWLGSAPGLKVTEPTPVTIGGLEGTRLDIELDPTWKRTCFYSEGLPTVPLIFNGSELGGYNVPILPDISMRWYVLESDAGVLVIDLDDGPNDLTHDELLRVGGAIVDSFVFDEPS